MSIEKTSTTDDTAMTSDVVVITGNVRESGPNGDSSEGDDNRHGD
jgi:hypothetical protein